MYWAKMGLKCSVHDDPSCVVDGTSGLAYVTAFVLKLISQRPCAKPMRSSRTGVYMPKARACGCVYSIGAL